MSKKLAAKAGLIQMPPMPSAESLAVGTPAAVPTDPAPPAAAPVAADGSGRARTAPGSMLSFMHTQSSAVREAEELRDRVKAFEGAEPVRRLDPASVRPSRWANRHELSFSSAEFSALKAEIASAGGNVQPIKVRPLADGQGFEVIYGHRRHRACLELGVPVRALVSDVTDQVLFVEMERENRQRKDLSAWEQGQMYARALDAGLYPSNRKLAEAIGRDLGDVGKALSLARLPQAIVEAFASPLDLQYRWAKPLSDALQRDPEGTMRRARELKKQWGKLAAAEVFATLIQSGEGVGPSNPPQAHAIVVGGKTMGQVKTDARGRVVVEFESGAMSAEKAAELVAHLQAFLKPER